ncbi:MAG: aminotransferase class V-fold PLP-dependent enzyme, partial [Variovorax sp.]|nr:aminotransferase class V-fold PLP-dependent enzyme [Variovorax sp.]
MTLTLQDCRALDAQDPLRALRDLFHIPEGTIYLDGNSLGVMPSSAPARVADVVAREWGTDLIQSWNKNGWFAMPKKIGDKIARLIGAAPGTVVATDSTSINLFKVLSAAMHLAQADSPGRKRIVSERSNFPTDLYIAEALCRERGFELALVEPDEIAAALTPEVAVLMLTHVNYRTGAMHDMPAMTAAAHATGALMLWDLAH